MVFTHKALAAVWLVVFGLFAVSSSGAITGSAVALLVVVSLLTPAIILLGPKRWRVAEAAGPVDMGTLAASDARDLGDLMRMESGKR